MSIPAPLNWLKGGLSESPESSTIWGATIMAYDWDDWDGEAEKIHTIVDTSLQKLWQNIGTYINFSLMDDSRDATFDPNEVGFYFNENEEGVQIPTEANTEAYGVDAAVKAKLWWDMIYGTTPIPWKYIYPESEDKYSGKDRHLTYKLIFKDWDMRPTIWGYDDDEAGYRIDWLSYSGMFEDEEANEHIGNILGHTKLTNFLEGWDWHEKISEYEARDERQNYIAKMKHEKRVIPINAEIYDDWLVYNWSSSVDYVLFLWKQT
ncbi:hypothetical protein N9M17_00745 [bacterium]|jgi:hypothetical protein|nr:hypothetical protein [bacterium]